MSLSFRMFVGDQVGRLSQFRDFGTLAESGRKEIISWVAQVSGHPGHDKRTQPAPNWLVESEPARRVKALVDECCGLEAIGGKDREPVATIKAVWAKLYPSITSKTALPDCEYCRGLGWEEIEGVVKSGPFAGNPCTGVSRCRCGGMPPDIWRALLELQSRRQSDAGLYEALKEATELIVECTDDVMGTSSETEFATMAGKCRAALSAAESDPSFTKWMNHRREQNERP